MWKQFVLFTGDKYYPCGGASDFHSSYDAIEDAIGVGTRWLESTNRIGFVWFHVLDRISGEIVYES